MTPASQIPNSRRGAIGLTGLALTALSSGLVAVPTAAHASSAPAPAPAPAPGVRTNGPIAYSVQPNGSNGPDIWKTVNPDGSGQAEVPAGDPRAFDGIGAGVPNQSGMTDYGVGPFIGTFAYSPDGTRVVFPNYWNACAELADADGTNPTVLAGGDCVRGDVSYRARDLKANVGGKPVWSADSKSVYFQSGASIVAIDAAATVATPVALKVSIPATYRLDSVSPSGAFAFSDYQTNHIFILDPGASTFRQLTSGIHASFSPDGSTLLISDFSPAPTSGFSLLEVNASTGARTPLTDPATESVDTNMFCWSPDGTSVAYVANRTLYTRSATPGGKATTVVSDPHGVLLGDWHNGPLTPPRALDRIGGTDRVATSIAVSQWSYSSAGAGGTQAKVAVLSRSDQFADALGGSALAAQKNGPLLLTATGQLDPRVGAELRRILAPGSTVYVLGGFSALSPAVEQQIRGLGLTPVRLKGNDRFETSAAVAAAISPHPHTVMVATGRNFPDALAAGAAAAQDPAGGVVLLSDDGTLPAAGKRFLAGTDPHSAAVYGVGGQGVKALASAFPQWAGLTTPLKGSDRYSTAAAVAGSALFTAHGPVPYVGLATGDAWPDALSGGALIGRLHGPLLLTTKASQYLPQPQLDYLRALAPHLSGITVFGGENAVATEVEVNTGESGLGRDRFYTFTNRSTPPVTGAR
ncbi:cell wall-binding repeat-containing protein [Catenulispora rubra]|uniref:cell wall-binding repeat-containing protein n=1 Tax=Catenulispora rubra TaxID=280293 RepID=UPI001892875A|nr:cell wall-binding repeat-containing protein [Catenulispora rubra]